MSIFLFYIYKFFFFTSATNRTECSAATINIHNRISS